MSIQLKLDEMLEIVQGLDPNAAEHFEMILCGTGNTMAQMIGEKFDCEYGTTTMDGVAFAGICCPFFPLRHAQPCPDELGQYDPGGVEDWDVTARELEA